MASLRDANHGKTPPRWGLPPRHLSKMSREAGVIGFFGGLSNTRKKPTVLPERLRHSHAEIRPGENMSRPDFKKALKELE